MCVCVWVALRVSWYNVCCARALHNALMVHGKLGATKPFAWRAYISNIIYDVCIVFVLRVLVRVWLGMCVYVQCRALAVNTNKLP